MGSRQLSTICESIEAVLINTIQVRQNNYTNIADFYLYMYLKVVQFKTFFTWNQMKIWMCTSIRRKFLMFHFLQCVEMGKKLRFLRKVERATLFPSNHRFDLKKLLNKALISRKISLEKSSKTDHCFTENSTFFPSN